MSAENKITKEKNILLVLSKKKDSSKEQLELIELFCGTVIFSVTDDKLSNTDNRIFACGDISLLNKEISQLRIIREISWGFENYENENTLFVSLGSVPINVHNVGVYFRSMIKAHSDKTKDMPKDGIIAFCTFYDKSNFEQLKPSKNDKFDWVYKQTSGLTRLHFKLKATVNDDSLVKHFSVTLYPNSVFLIPLSTNRLYTHEIKPSVLNIDRIPIRLGYVARCSDLEASYINGQTYITEDGELIKLEQIGEGDMGDLRDSYYKENRTEEKVKYGKVHFSMNSGDYKKPIF